MHHGERKAAVALLSVLPNATLVIAKLVIEILIGSVSVLSESIHSGVDLIAVLIAWFAVETSGRPADKEHPQVRVGALHRLPPHGPPRHVRG